MEPPLPNAPSLATVDLRCALEALFPRTSFRSRNRRRRHRGRRFPQPSKSRVGYIYTHFPCNPSHRIFRKQKKQRLSSRADIHAWSQRPPRSRGIIPILTYFVYFISLLEHVASVQRRRARPMPPRPIPKGPRLLAWGFTRRIIVEIHQSIKQRSL